MANLSKTRALFAWTSPRTVEKIIPEIKLLIDLFGGQKWSGNKVLQTEFYKALVSSDFFEKQKQNNNPDFAARERVTRAPKALGFVDLKPLIRLTEVGENLLSGKRTHEVIAKQLFKFQLPSPYYKVPSNRNFNVRPYLELLRLVKELDNLSKLEVAIFFVQITHYNRVDLIVDAIRKFREDAKTDKGNRKAFNEEIFTKEILKTYAEDIKTNNLKTREGGDSRVESFIKKKKGNHRDYADAFMRYLRGTQLITFDRKNFRMIIAPSRKDEVDYILNNMDRNAFSFKTETEFKNYLFNPSSLLLLTDDRNYLEDRLYKLGIEFKTNTNIDDLKDLLEATEEQMIS